MAVSRLRWQVLFANRHAHRQRLRWRSFGIAITELTYGSEGKLGISDRLSGSGSRQPGNGRHYCCPQMRKRASAARRKRRYRAPNLRGLGRHRGLEPGSIIAMVDDRRRTAFSSGVYSIGAKKMRRSTTPVYSPWSKIRSTDDGPFDVGTSGKDVIFATVHDDTLKGGQSADQFVFAEPHGHRHDHRFQARARTRSISDECSRSLPTIVASIRPGSAATRRAVRRGHVDHSSDSTTVSAEERRHRQSACQRLHSYRAAALI